MKAYFSSSFKYLAVLMLSLTLHVATVSASTSQQPSVRLSGHVPDMAIANAAFLEDLDTNTQVPVTFTLPLRNKEVLEELIQRIHNPADEQNYGKYLTSKEFVEQFAPTQEDYDKVIAYAKKLGLTISNTHPNRTLLNAIGTSGSLETAFNLRLHLYQEPSGRKFHSPSNNPEVPVSIASIISGIVGLDNHAVWRPFNRQKETTETFRSPHASPSSPAGYSPNDILTAYNLAEMPVNGSGQNIALLELASYRASDINAYTNFFGLPSAKLHNILVDGGSHSGIDAEVTLDIELAIALAPESQIYVYEGPNSNQGILDIYNRIATDNLAKQVSTSWGLGEDLEGTQYFQSESAIFQQMAAQGQTIYAAAGDDGAYDDGNSSLVVDDPASQPYVVGVGGTRLIVDSGTGAYGSESVWNNGAGNGAGGGGVSAVWPIPSWQTNVSTVHSKTHRNVPDVSLNADPDTGYAIYYDGQWTVYGGTSCAAPLWASFTALVNQELEANQRPALGFANPLFYSIGTGSAYTANFHDITSGNNLYYSAHTGYDNATGWGTFNGKNLFASLTQSSSPASLLNIIMKHKTPLTKGGTGTYQVVVSNHGNASTSGIVSVAITLPNSLTYKSFSGSGWTFDKSTLTFTQSNPLEPGSSYPTIMLSVNVAQNAPHTVSPSATVSGEGLLPAQSLISLLLRTKNTSFGYLSESESDPIKGAPLP